jgi:putative polyketide hydroxylase
VLRALARVDVGAIQRNCARLAAIAAPWADRVHLVPAGPGERADRPETVLLRPDGYIAWRSADAVAEPKAVLDGVLRRVLQRT